MNSRQFHITVPVDIVLNVDSNVTVEQAISQLAVISQNLSVSASSAKFQPPTQVFIVPDNFNWLEHTE